VASDGRVLVVDDEPAIRALVAKIVERAGLPVSQACDGAEAIAKIDQHDYAVVVLDLNMPNIDGFGFIDHIRHRAVRPAIIAISAADSALLRRLDGSMVHSIVRKPFDIDVLGDLITAAAQTALDEERKQARDGNVLPFQRDSHNVC
jgi:DNA-binding response OmpR family regulator